MFNIYEISITELASKLRNRELSVKELVQEYIDRIHTLDQGKDGWNSVLEINPDALTIAEGLDDRLSKNSSILYGVPILLKDNIATSDQMHTSAGSLALADSIPTSDAEIVKTLRSKGAVILGKTNMTEFANYMTKGMPAGYSSRGGKVKSPYKKDGDPSGSSTGSAVAVTTNLCTVSLGTDTSGSIISPGLKNGIVGFRPSMGAFSSKGLVPISMTCDTIGPMTRTVADSAILYSETTGFPVEMEDQPNYKSMTVGVNEWALKNMKEEEVKKSEGILKELEKVGVNIKRLNIEPIPTEQIKGIQRYEFKFAMNNYLSGLPKEYPIRTLKDIIEYNNQHKEQTLLYGQSLLTDAEDNTMGDLSENEYIELMKDRERHKQEIFDLMREMPICLMFQDNLLMQYIGMPMITIPHGLYNDGMPFGVCLTALTDTDLLKNAYALERVIGNRVPPK